MSAKRLMFVLPFLVLAGTAAVSADQLVFFTSGRGIVATKVEERGGWVFLEFQGGAVLGVPSAKVDRIEETDLTQSDAGGFGNKILPPDVSQRASSGPVGQPYQPGVPPDGGANAAGQRLPSSLPGGAQRNLGPRGPLNTQGVPGGPQGNVRYPQQQVNPGAQFGLQPINLTGQPGPGQPQVAAPEDQEEEEAEE
ncbi:MAG: hypothetical protein HY509_03615 [Acidobacteria bacterium]|nr:hypothetical protein [Acidobacteriota bacterium]